MSKESLDDFAQMPLLPALHRVIDEVGYETPTPIQARSILV